MYGRKDEVMVKINGTEENVQGMPLMDYLEREGYKRNQIAVECNEEIVPKAEYEKKILRDGDVLEIVSFVGGG